MTSATVRNCFGRYLKWRTNENKKELPDVTIRDMQRVWEDEREIVHCAEVEREINYELENNQ